MRRRSQSKTKGFGCATSLLNAVISKVQCLWALRSEHSRKHLVRWSLNPNSIGFFFAGGERCYALVLQGKLKSTFSLVSRRELLSPAERKTRVYWFSMSIVHTKQSGVAFESVTVLLRDLLEWNFHQRVGFEKLISSMLNSREKN
jgi:hypothetical protein